MSGPLVVGGTGAGTSAGYHPMPDLALAGPVRAYTAWVAARLPALTG
ncbi:MAG TPA: hypothetical protein VMI73_21420 [Trebonia sp.]|nr:hypothetical protein [Trebonia sp.]